MESELVVFGSMTHPGAGEERAGSMQQHDIRNILPIGRITGSDHLTGLLCGKETGKTGKDNDCCGYDNTPEQGNYRGRNLVSGNNGFHPGSANPGWA